VRNHKYLPLLFVFAIVACGPAANESGRLGSAGPAPADGSIDSSSTAPAAPGTAVPASAVPVASAGNETSRWLAAAPMLKERRGFEAVLLDDGSVLVVGDHWECRPGGAEPGSEQAERYDPAADRWTAVDPLNKPRKDFAMVGTIDGGAMVIGGLNTEDVPFSSTKTFEPATGTWSSGPLLDLAIGDPVAVALSDGRIFVGATSYEETNASTVMTLYAPSRGVWDDSPTIEGQSTVAFVVLSDGRLIAWGGGFELSGLLSVTDPGGAEGWSDFAAPDFDDVQSLVALPAGGMLAFGWDQSELGSFASGRVQRYDPADGRWHEAAPIPTPRSGFQLATLADGRVLVAGGVYTHDDIGGEEIYRTTEIYDPAADAWIPGPALNSARYGGHAITLDDGSVLVLGGVDQLDTQGATPFCPPPLSTVERLYPAP
jgi:hypothetical protein